MLVEAGIVFLLCVVLGGCGFAAGYLTGRGTIEGKEIIYVSRERYSRIVKG